VTAAVVLAAELRLTDLVIHAFTAAMLGWGSNFSQVALQRSEIFQTTSTLTRQRVCEQVLGRPFTFIKWLFVTYESTNDFAAPKTEG